MHRAALCLDLMTSAAGKLLNNWNVDVTSPLVELACGILREGSTSPAIKVFSISIRARPDALAVCLNSENQHSTNSTT